MGPDDSEWVEANLPRAGPVPVADLDQAMLARRIPWTTAAVSRVQAALMTMKKIDVAKLEAAFQKQ